jgi:putative MATE family efflux protein
MSTGTHDDAGTLAPSLTPGDQGAPAAEVHRDDLSLRTAVLDALRGRGHHDYTTGDLGRAILLLAVPMVLEMVLESVFAVTDIFVAGRLGPQAIATIGLTESMLTIVYTLAMGLGIGATASVARRVGEKDPDGAAETAVQAVAIGFVVSIVLGVTGVALAPRLLALMGAEPSLIATGSTYTRVMLGGEVSIIMLFLVNAIFRGAGDAAIAMRTLWLANAINIVLVPCFVFGLGPFPRLGVTGAAVATTIGRGTGALYAISRLFHPDSRVRIHRRHMKLLPDVMARLIRLSGSGTLQVLIGSASWILLVRILSGFGSNAVAGYTIGIRVLLFVLLPSWGLSNAAATMVGQSLGARDPARAERAVWLAGKYNAIFLGSVSVLFLIFAPQITSWFTSDAEVARIASTALRIMSSGFVFYAYGGVLTAAFNGAGDTWTPTWMNFAVFWLWEIPLAWALAHPLGVGPAGAFWAVTIAFSTLSLVSAVMFKRGTWKKAVA